MLVFELISVILFAAAATWAAWRIGRSRYWWIGFVTPLLPLTLIIIGHRSVRLSFFPPFSWAVDLRISPLLMAVTIPLMLVTLLARLPRGRATVAVLAVTMIIFYSVLPLACPALAQNALAASATRLDRHGVCLQSQPYTCGPAAAVTCLRVLGVDAHEGMLAIAARCGPIVGTDEPQLAHAINALFQNAGIHSTARYVASLNELTTPAVADTSMPLIGGHYIAVLAITADDVIVGDPYNGWARLPRAQFLAIWKNSAIVFTPLPTQSPLAPGLPGETPHINRAAPNPQFIAETIPPHAMPLPLPVSPQTMPPPAQQNAIIHSAAARITPHNPR